ncbi:pilus assembly protein N-terminal domain-containing protein [Vibrio europaeus]|uniref:type II and III secretion system protein family protein n=1 Tax=Vibrio europaeus TaxID=300876 RepID=UPI0018A7167E|nr:pilus assembly protein N-terminal domain-containing protein [Vibrio europaeus]MDC5810022.1 pilus assembly protein N-terminal domain-containing protein [Vibrio europaeus]QPG37498.1 pilus assembly protein N-terminal domain-containing protein [Vibrio europaeus]
MKKLLISLCALFFLAPSVSNAQRSTYLSEGEMEIISVGEDIDSVFISNPKVADYQVIDKRKVALFGKALGETGFAVFGTSGKTLTKRKVTVNTSLTELESQVQLLYPNANVKLTHIGDNVVLTGTVANEKTKDAINQMVGELLEKEKEEFTIEWNRGDDDYEMEFMKRFHFTGVVNQIEVVTQKQVNVKLSIAEVSHSFLEEFGVQYGSQGQSAGVFVNPLTSFSASDIISVITAMGNDTVGQILAQPNLSVMSGETANFLVGGELPVVTVVDGTTNVEYKEFGIRLDLMAKVIEDDKIKLSLMPEVSSLDTQYSNASYNLPALKTRRARTTVQLADGKSFVLGGLLSTEDKESLSQIPFIGEIPVLGALFRSSGTERTRTELVIVATVNLVQPVEPSAVQLPTMQRTTSLERFFNVEPTPSNSEQNKWANEIYATGGFKL